MMPFQPTIATKGRRDHAMIKDLATGREGNVGGLVMSIFEYKHEREKSFQSPAAGLKAPPSIFTRDGNVHQEQGASSSPYKQDG
jgi:hypothetical protein